MDFKGWLSKLRQGKEISPEKIGFQQIMNLKTFEKLEKIADAIATSDNPRVIYVNAQRLIPFLKRVVGARKAEEASRDLAWLYGEIRRTEELMRSAPEKREELEDVYTFYVEKLRDYAFRIYGQAVKAQDVDFSRPLIIQRPIDYVDTMTILEGIGFTKTLKDLAIREFLSKLPPELRREIEEYMHRKRHKPPKTSKTVDDSFLDESLGGEDADSTESTA